MLRNRLNLHIQRKPDVITQSISATQFYSNAMMLLHMPVAIISNSMAPFKKSIRSKKLHLGRK